MADGNLPTYVTESTTVPWFGGFAIVRLAGSFVNFSGNAGITGLGFLGVLNHDVPANTPGGTPVGVDVEGIVQVNSGGAITLGAALTCQSIAGGEFIVAIAGQDIHGRAMSTATAAGQRVLMKITREGKA